MTSTDQNDKLCVFFFFTTAERDTVRQEGDEEPSADPGIQGLPFSE